MAAAHTPNFLSVSAAASHSEPRRISGWNFAAVPPVVNSFAGAQLRMVAFKTTALIRRRPTTMTVLLSLPNTIPKNGTEQKLKWSSRAIRAFALGELEARKLKYPNTGTESILMGILVEGTSVAAKFLRANGIDIFKVRDETVNLLGKSDVHFHSPEHPPMTEQAQKAIDWAIEQNLKSEKTSAGGDGQMTPIHLLLGVWAQKESAGQIILENLGFNDEKANEIAKSMDKDTVFSYK